MQIEDFEAWCASGDGEMLQAQAVGDGVWVASVKLTNTDAARLRDWLNKYLEGVEG